MHNLLLNLYLFNVLVIKLKLDVKRLRKLESVRNRDFYKIGKNFWLHMQEKMKRPLLLQERNNLFCKCFYFLI